MSCPVLVIVSAQAPWDASSDRRTAMRHIFGIVLAFFALFVPTSTVLVHAAPACQYVLGFASLYALDPTDIGNCTDNQQSASNGDAQQTTTNGLMVWRKADNWTAFTNGFWTWINGPDGLAKRLNNQRFSWEANP